MEEATFSDNSKAHVVEKFYSECKDSAVIDEYERLMYIAEDDGRSVADQNRALSAARKIISDFTQSGQFKSNNKARSFSRK